MTRTSTSVFDRVEVFSIYALCLGNRDEGVGVDGFDQTHDAYFVVLAGYDQEDFLVLFAVPAPAVEQSYASLDFFADGVGYLFVQAGHDCYLVGLFPSFDHKVYGVGINA